MLALAITSLGVQTSLQQLAGCGWSPLLLIVLETLFLAVITLIFVMYISPLKPV